MSCEVHVGIRRDEVGRDLRVAVGSSSIERCGTILVRKVPGGDGLQDSKEASGPSSNWSRPAAREEAAAGEVA